MASRSSTRVILAENLRKVRVSRGLSQEKLGELANLHRTYIGSVERAERNISIDNIEALARALGIEPGDLLRGAKSK